ncbi:OmpA family protein [bacterium]
MKGRKAEIVGTVPNETLIDSLKSSLSQIPGIQIVFANFTIHEDSIKASYIRQLSNRHVYFQTNSVQLPPSSEITIDSLAAFLKQYTRMHLTIQGHTDSEGDSLYNQNLSIERASSIYNRLIQFDCDSTRMHVIGLGEDLTDSLQFLDSLARRVDFIFKEANE